MDYNLIELEYSRLLNHQKSLRENHYSDKRLYQYQGSLINLFENIGRKICDEDFRDSSIETLVEVGEILQFIKISIETLNDSVFNLLPFETLYCIDSALREWMDVEKEEFESVIVVTNRYNSYFFWGYLSLQESLFKFIEVIYEVKFSQRLVLISIPKFEINDYLTNVVLYHELGHYIETKYSIVERIIREDSKTRSYDYANHLKEWFCDIFAAQYVGNTISRYVNYIGYNNKVSYTHPSTKSRLSVVDGFVNNRANFILNTLKNATLKTTTRNLEKRYSEFEKDDFINLIPYCIKDRKELHYLYILGWSLWTNKQSEYKDFQNERIYEIINNLIEKSISNYIVRESWNKAKPYVLK